MPLEAELSALANALRTKAPNTASDFGVTDRGGPDSAFAPRVDVYRRLVRERFAGSVATTLGETYALLGEARTAQVIDAFLAQEGVHSPYFRDVACEIARFIERTADALGLSDDEVDTARYEATRFEVTLAIHDEAGPRLPFALDRAIRFSAAVRLFRARSAVHLVPHDDRPAPTQLLVYREPERGRPHVLALSEAAFAILSALHAGDTLAAGITHGAEQAGVPLSAAVMEEISALLTDLSERQVLLSAV